MKKLLVSIFILLSITISTFSQSNNMPIDSKNWNHSNSVGKKSSTDDIYYENNTQKDMTPGDELIKYANHNYLSYGLTFGGGIVYVAGINTEFNSITNIFGGVLILTGVILQIESYSHIKKAGKKLNMKPVKNGIAFEF